MTGVEAIAVIVAAIIAAAAATTTGVIGATTTKKAGEEAKDLANITRGRHSKGRGNKLAP